MLEDVAEQMDGQSYYRWYERGGADGAIIGREAMVGLHVIYMAMKTLHFRNNAYGIGQDVYFLRIAPRRYESYQYWS